MIEIILPDPPSKFAPTVLMWSKKALMEKRAFKHIQEPDPSNYNCLPPRQVKSKSYELGAYPPNVIGEKHYE